MCEYELNEDNERRNKRRDDDHYYRNTDGWFCMLHAMFDIGSKRAFIPIFGIWECHGHDMDRGADEPNCTREGKN